MEATLERVEELALFEEVKGVDGDRRSFSRCPGDLSRFTQCLHSRWQTLMRE